MSQERRMIWFGSFLGGAILLLFSAIGLSQYCKNVDLMPKVRSDQEK
ncbi:hypothetical protein ACSVDE_17625 [Pseudalkalibacillus sp. Hm43]